MTQFRDTHHLLKSGVRDIAAMRAATAWQICEHTMTTCSTWKTAAHNIVGSHAAR
jgi:hypothetical protein